MGAEAKCFRGGFLMPPDFETFYRSHCAANEIAGAALELLQSITDGRLYGEPLDNPALEQFRKQMQHVHATYCLPDLKPARPKLSVVQ
jgi:hypothetical protein